MSSWKQRAADNETRPRMRVKASGWMFILSLALTLTAAWNTGANLLYLVLGGLGSFIVISFVLSSWNFKRLTISRTAPAAVHRGDPFPVTIRIENHKRLVPTVSVRAERSQGAGDTAAYFIKIPPHRAGLIRVSETLARRGVYTLPPLDIVSGFPCGLVERRRALTDSLEIVVYPRVTAIRAGALEQLSGTRHVPRLIIGDGTDFFSMRDYVPGDDLRHIAWRVSARRGTLTVKEMSRETSRNMTFVLDTFWAADTPEFDAHFEDTIDLVASLAATLLNHQYTISILTPDASLKGDEGKGHVVKALEMLARIMPTTSDEHRDFKWFTPGGDSYETTFVFVSPDPAKWGRTGPTPGTRVINPGEAVRA